MELDYLLRVTACSPKNPSHRVGIFPRTCVGHRVVAAVFKALRDAADQA